MNDDQAKPIFLCSCNDNNVRLYDLPSFRERGRIFSRSQVRTFKIGPARLFFTGDGEGELKVWKLSTQTLCEVDNTLNLRSKAIVITPQCKRDPYQHIPHVELLMYSSL